MTAPPAFDPGTQGDFSFQLLLRHRLDRETDLLIQRTAWVVGSQAFLFSAFAVALNSPARAAPDVVGKARLLVVLLPWIAIISLLLLLVTIGAGIAALGELRRHTHKADPRAHILDEGPVVRLSSLAAPLLVPTAFLVTWVVLMFS